MTDSMIWRSGLKNWLPCRAGWARPCGRGGAGRRSRRRDLAYRIVEPVDISHAVLWLASDESRYVTGVTLPIDAGVLVK